MHAEATQRLLAVLEADFTDQVGRPMDSSSCQRDGLLGVVFAFATTQRDNPALISHSGGRWLRHDTLRGTPVDVFEYCPHARFRMEQGGARLLRFEGRNPRQTLGHGFAS